MRFELTFSKIPCHPCYAYRVVLKRDGRHKLTRLIRKEFLA